MTPLRGPTGWNHVRTILVPTDFSARTDNAFSYALGLARQGGAVVHLMHVIGPVEGEAYSPLRYTPEAAVLQHDPQKNIYDLLHIIETPSFLKPITGLATLGDLAPDIGAKAEAYLTRLRDEAGNPSIRVQTHLEEGQPASRIVHFAHQHNTDLVVIATRGLSGMKRFFLGSVTERVVRAAPCPVFCVKTDGTAAPEMTDHAVPEAEETA